MRMHGCLLAAVAAVWAFGAHPARADEAAGADEAELALRLGLSRLAFERASAALDALDPGPERDRAFLLAAAAKEGEGSPEAVAEWVRTVVSPPPAADWFRGRALCGLGRPAEAAALLKDLLSRLEDDNPIRPSVVADCARALSLAGSDREAALVASRAPGTGGAKVSVFALAAGIDAGAEPPDDVPDSVRALAFAAAAVLRARGASGPPPDEALALAARAVSLASDDPAALSECRGVELELLAARGRSGDAVDAARRLVAGERSGGASEAVLSAASSLLARGDAESALALAELHDASFSDPSSEPGAQRLRALSLEALGRASEAVAAWDAAAAAAAAAGDPDAAAEARLEAARLVLADGRADDASARLDAVRSAGVPKTLATRFDRLSAECLAAGNAPEAPAAFEKAAAEADGSPEALEATVRAAESTPAGDAALAARTASADAALAEMVDTSAGDDLPAVMRRQAAAALAVALKAVGNGDAAGAVSRLELAAATPDGGAASERAQALLPAAYQAAGRYDEALASYAIFTNQHPASAYLPDLRFWRASRHFDSGEWAEAADALLMLCAEFPSSAKAPHAAYLAAVALLRAGREEDAIAAVDRLAALDPDSPLLPQARFMQAEALASLMRFDAAALAFARVTGPGGGDPSLPLRAAMRRADCLYALGGEIPARRAESLVVYRQVFADPACAASGLEPECRWKIGRVLARNGESDAAIREWFDGCIAPFEREPSAGAAPWYSRAIFSAAAEQLAAGRQADAVALLSRLATSADLPGREEAARRLEALGAQP